MKATLKKKQKISDPLKNALESSKLVVGIVGSVEDWDPIVEEKEKDDEEDCDGDARSEGAMDCDWLAGDENSGEDGRAMIEGEKLERNWIVKRRATICKREELVKQGFRVQFDNSESE